MEAAGGERVGERHVWRAERARCPEHSEGRARPGSRAPAGHAGAGQAVPRTDPEHQPAARGRQGLRPYFDRARALKPSARTRTDVIWKTAQYNGRPALGACVDISFDAARLFA